MSKDEERICDLYNLNFTKMKALKLVSGLDISKSEFHANLVLLLEDQSIKVVKSRKFYNTAKGIKEYFHWFDKVTKKHELPVFHVMEATGVYHEHLALKLFESQQSVSVVLPNKSKKYIQALGIKTKNDKTDARAMAMMGAQQKLDLWQPMGDYFYQLRAMTRMHQNYQENITALKNQIEALEHGMYKQVALIKDLQSLISRYEKLLKKLIKNIEEHISSDELTAKKIDGICRIKGVSMLTVAVILAETNGFTLFTNSRQLVSYSGYDVVENQSGKHRGKTKISKKGNSRIRRALLMPGFNVVKHEPRFREFYERIMTSKEKKMIGYVAVQKKILVIIFSLWKNNQAYDPNYLQQRDTTGDYEQAHLSRSFVFGENKNSAA